MRVLLLVGCIALGVVVVAASHQDRAESGIEAERVQGDFVKDREIRSTGGNKKKNKPPRKATPGVFSSLARPSKTLVKRSARESPPDQGKRKKCPGCYTSLIVRPKPRLFDPIIELRQARDTEVHGKLRKKHKHLKEKSKSKRRRNKEHREGHREREGHDHFQTEDPEFGQNNKRRKHHHRGKKDKENRRHAGMFTAMGGALPDTKKTRMDIPNTEMGSGFRGPE